MDLEKAFDRVLREGIRWAMCKLGVEEWLVSAVVYMYTGATGFKMFGSKLVNFNIQTGLAQRSRVTVTSNFSNW